MSRDAKAVVLALLILVISLLYTNTLKQPTGAATTDLRLPEELKQHTEETDAVTLVQKSQPTEDTEKKGALKNLFGEDTLEKYQVSEEEMPPELKQLLGVDDLA